MVLKGVFWTIGEHLYFVYFPLISYQRIKFYRIETINMVILIYNNGVGVKFNPSKYFGIIVRYENSLVGFIRC